MYEVPGWKTAQNEEDLAQLFRCAQLTCRSRGQGKQQSPLLYPHVHGTHATVELCVPAVLAPFECASLFHRGTERA